MRQPKISTEALIEFLAMGKTIAEISSITESKKYSVNRQIERLRVKHNCANTTQLVVKLKLSGLNTIEEQPK